MGKNRPDLEHVRAVGPLPRGMWKIGKAYKSPTMGPMTLNLDPVGHNAHGRSLFRIHGDSIKKPGTASSGCIILPRTARNLIAASGITELMVVEG